MRLITRTDLDGVACAVFITQMEDIEQVLFAEPKDIEDGTIVVRAGDAIANLPYHTNAALWFDHHDKAEEAPKALPNVKGNRGAAPSTARLVYLYYDTPRLKRFEPMLTEVDRIDSAKLTLDEVLDPKGWVLLSFTLDPYMGLAAFTGYANAVISAIRTGSPVEQVLDMTDVKGRVNLYKMDADDFKEMIRRTSRVDGNVIVTDLRKETEMPTGNRFLAFALYPEANVQLVLTHHSAKNKVRVRMGKSIFNRTCRLHLGKLAGEFDGGGLDGAAGCLLDYDDAEPKIERLIERLKA